jgi:hypothetical protein
MNTMLNIIAASRRRVSFDADFSAYLALGISNGSSMSAANQIAVNAFFVGAKADGFFSAIKASCLLCAWDSLAGALTPIVGTAPTNNNFVSGDYSRTTGLLGDGSTKYLNANRNNNADPQNSRHLYFYMSAPDTTTASSTTYIGTANNAAGSLVGKIIAGGTSHGYRSASGQSARTVSRAVGGWGVSRSVSTDINRLAAGSLDSASITSASPANAANGVFATGGGLLHSNARISFYSIGEFLDLSLIDARIATLMSSLT